MFRCLSVLFNLLIFCRLQTDQQFKVIFFNYIIQTIQKNTLSRGNFFSRLLRFFRAPPFFLKIYWCINTKGEKAKIEKKVKKLVNSYIYIFFFIYSFEVTCNKNTEKLVRWCALFYLVNYQYFKCALICTIPHFSHFVRTVLSALILKHLKTGNYK